MRNCGVTKSFSLSQDKILMAPATFLWTIFRIYHESNEELALNQKIQKKGQ